MNKEILTLEQDHLDQMDDHAYNIKSLDTYRAQNENLRNEIAELKSRK